MIERVDALDAADAAIAAKLTESLVATAYPGAIDRAEINRRAVSLGRGVRRGTRPALLGAAVGMAFITVLAVSASLNQGVSSARQASPPPVRFVEVSQAVSYGSISDLTAASDLVVLGVPESASTAPDPETPSLPRTTFSVRVDQLLKGGPVGAQVSVDQTGGPSLGEVVAVRDDPLMVLGDRVVLFLRRVPGAEPSFIIVGGPQGRFMVTGDSVSPLPAGIPGLGLTLANLQASIR